VPGEAEIGRHLRGKSWRVQFAVVAPIAVLWSVEAWFLSPFLALVAAVFWFYAVYLVVRRPQRISTPH
jgi:phosphate/sulfate permease